jgi:nitrogen fixation protein FixH
MRLRRAGLAPYGRWMRRIVTLCIALCAGSAGCGSGGTAATGELVASSGSLTGTLEASPLEVGLNTAEVSLLDAEGAPLEGATVTISPWMPAHGHGTETVEAEATGVAGTYATERLRFQMGGVWELRVHVVHGDDEGELVATIEVP